VSAESAYFAGTLRARLFIKQRLIAQGHSNLALSGPAVRMSTIAPLTVEHHGPKVHPADAAFNNIGAA
jgi:hypothetical protein